MLRLMQRTEEVAVKEIPGAASLELAEGVVPLDPQKAVLEAMLTGWQRQQTARFLRHDATIWPRLGLVRRMMAFTGLYPWQWTPAEAEAFIAHLRSGPKPVKVSTARGYVIALRIFCEYAADARYGWPAECQRRFGACVTQVFHEWNSVVHVGDYEGDPARRPLTYEEVQALFDAADGRVEEIRARRRKGALTAMRDAAMLKTAYAYGLRRQECCGLDLADLRHSPKAALFGRFGALFVRHGKASRGGASKRRTVLTVPEMDWIVPVLEQWVNEIRPLLSPGQHPALWVTERRGRIRRQGVNAAFETVRVAAGLPEELDLHSLRHSYVTHLVEFGYPERFVQEQVGHAYAATTALYTGVSDEYRTRLVQRALRQQLGDLWEDAK
jgi:site-specific recombinase XerD